MRVLVVAGASGGHIFPALSFLEELKEKHKDIELLLVLPKRSIDKQFITKDIFQIKYIITPKVSLRPSAIFKYLLGSVQSLEILLKFKPDVVVGFGSSDSVPLVLLAWLFRIKTLIHEQNVVPGRANRILAKLVDNFAVSFAQTSEYLNINPKRITVTGNPIRRDLVKLDKKEALKFFGLSDKFTLLVMGGSQGSHRINLALLNSLSGLDRDFGFQVIHIAGVNEVALVNKGYENLNIEAKVFTFLPQINYAYSASDLVISRAGASTIYELVFFEKPAILIPYPFAYAHQLKNAEVLEKIGSACIVKDSALDYSILKDTLKGLFVDTQRLNNMRECYKDMGWLNAASLLVNLALQLK